SCRVFVQAKKALVKLQALVRGFLVRRQAAATLQSMQALIARRPPCAPTASAPAPPPISLTSTTLPFGPAARCRRGAPPTIRGASTA
ncbi:Os01g0280200, partial [Oryza sativa Japonica Group]